MKIAAALFSFSRRVLSSANEVQDFPEDERYKVFPRSTNAPILRAALAPTLLAQGFV